MRGCDRANAPISRPRSGGSPLSTSTQASGSSSSVARAIRTGPRRFASPANAPLSSAARIVAQTCLQCAPSSTKCGQSQSTASAPSSSASSTLYRRVPVTAARMNESDPSPIVTAPSRKYASPRLRLASEKLAAARMDSSLGGTTVEDTNGPVRRPRERGQAQSASSRSQGPTGVSSNAGCLGSVPSEPARSRPG
jgi:hypothetical protein